jgi:predicted amidohydrolase
MRILLAALRCEKGALAENLAEHRRVLFDARAADCSVAVFPEMSLTGSIDPARRADLLVELDSPVVAEMISSTAESGVAAMFGISERSAGGVAHITQVVAEDGRLLGVQRKRFLGEGEAAYTPDSTDAVFDVAGVPSGIAICAEGAYDRPFERASAAGARLVYFCAAPGLWGRRIDQPAWQRGWDWWRRVGLAQAQHHARTHGLWIALATQAGSAHDEDFPGLAALVDPAGSVVAQLPDWQPGALVVDIPLEA